MSILYIILIVIIAITMTLNVVNLASALMLVKKYEPHLKSVKGPCVFNPWNYNSLRLWFVAFSVFVSAISFMINAESMKTIYSVSDVRLWLAIKFYVVEIAVGVMIFQYHMLLLMDKRR